MKYCLKDLQHAHIQNHTQTSLQYGRYRLFCEKPPTEVCVVVMMLHQEKWSCCGIMPYLSTFCGIIPVVGINLLVGSTPAVSLTNVPESDRRDLKGIKIKFKVLKPKKEKTGLINIS